jgi:hypothetical protein
MQSWGFAALVVDRQKAPHMNLIKQPLVQFLVLGSLIFAIDFLVVGRTDDPRLILIDDTKFAEIAGIYRDNQGTDPSAQQMSNLLVAWAQNEVLYREARLMGLDKGDEMIRQRLILKLRNVLFNRMSEPAATEAELRQWFEENRARYDRPATYDFEQFKVGGPEASEAAIALSRSLGTADPGSEWENDIRTYEQRPLSNLAFVFGEDDSALLVEDETAQWQAVDSPAGWHLARITARYPGEPADFEAIRTRVGEDWKEKVSQAELATTLRDIAQRYDIRVQLTDPPAEWDNDRVEDGQLAMRPAE